MVGEPGGGEPGHGESGGGKPDGGEPGSGGTWWWRTWWESLCSDTKGDVEHSKLNLTILAFKMTVLGGGAFSTSLGCDLTGDSPRETPYPLYHE